MPSSNRERLGRSHGDRPAPEPRGLAAHVHAMSRGRAPAPRGKEIAMVVIGVGVVVAVVLQALLPSGPGERIREQLEAEQRDLPVAATVDPDQQPQPPAPRPVEIVESKPAEADEAWPVVPPGANIPVPEGLSERMAVRLRLALNGMTSARWIAESGVKDLALAVLDAEGPEREILADFVVGQLTSLVPTRRLGGTALDAALLLASIDPARLVPLTAAARSALADDERAAAAIVFLDHVLEADRKASGDAAFALALDAGRPLHLRVLAAEAASRWGAVSEERAEITDDGSVPLPVRIALFGE